MAARNATKTVLAGINRIFREALTARTEEELGRVCLAVAEEVTGSAFSFMGEINRATDRLDDLSVSERAWAHFSMDDPAFPRGKAPTGLRIHGIYGRVLRDGRGLFTNDPDAHPDRVGPPRGHPPLTCFLGVPLVEGGVTVGMIGLGNRPGGYRPADLEAAEALAPAILQALRSRRTGDALRESEERFRALADLVPALLWQSDAEGLVNSWNQPWFDYTGQTPDEAQDGGWLDAIHPEDREPIRAVFAAGHAAQQVIEVQTRVRGPAGYRWFLVRQAPLLDARGRATRWFGAAVDIHDLHEAQARQAVLVAELQHRTRNLIAVVRSLAEQTMARTGPTERFRCQFNNRLAALSRVQGLLSRSEEEPITLGALVRVELDALGAAASKRVHLEGPEVLLDKSRVQTLALALHELATNARKHGALSVPHGRLGVTWRIADGDAGRRVVLDWIEDGLALPEPPAQRGYGRELIEEALPYALGARTELAFTQTGARCAIDLPLAAQGGG